MSDHLETSIPAFKPAAPPNTVIAGMFAVTAFAVAIVSAVIAHRNAADAIADAILAMLVCYPIGYVAGRIANIAIDDHIQTHQARRPIPDIHAALRAPAAEIPEELTGVDIIEEGEEASATPQDQNFQNSQRNPDRPA